MPTTPPPSSAGWPGLDDHLHVRLLAASCLTIDHRWNAQRVRSSYWRLYVHGRSGAWLALERGRHALPPRQVHFVPPWVRFSCHNTRPLRHLFLHFDLLPLPAAVVRELFPAPVSLAPNTTTRSAIAMLRRQFQQRADRDAPVTVAAAKTLAYAALTSLFDQLEPAQAHRLQAFARGEHPVGPALRHIDQYLDEPLDNAQLAELCHFSESHFIRRFRDTLGQTPAQYILERRISRAAEQLLFTDQSIDHIAASTGFANRFHFTRMFTRRMGLPPAQYRRTDRV
ncbi:MAG: helix-turn-helix domain-containing protein [Phycisphaeraceae bacterium]